MYSMSLADQSLGNFPARGKSCRLNCLDRARGNKLCGYGIVSWLLADISRDVVVSMSR